MYRLGRGVRKSRKRHIRRLVFMIVLAVIGFGLWRLHIFMQDTNDQPITPQAITREYTPSQTSAVKTFDTPVFHMQLPSDWAFKEHKLTPYNTYVYQATAKSEDNRWLEIYVDGAPPTLAFNRVRPITIKGDILTPYDLISDNCYESAGNKPVPQQSYASVRFQCDIANYSRNVVGVGVVNQGTTLHIGGHTFVIVYTDHNVRPNYQILDDMLKSFSVKD